MVHASTLNRFDTMADYLLSLNSTLSPSELQGYIVGRLCAVEISDLEQLTEQSFQYMGLAMPIKEGGESLQAYCDLLQQSLLDSDFRFTLLLPGDDEALSCRLESIGQWCQSFLLGYRLDAKQLALSDPDISELIDDFDEISQIEFDVDEQDLDGQSLNQSETDLFEIGEFVRLSAISLFVAGRAQQSDESAQSGSYSSGDQSQRKLH